MIFRAFISLVLISALGSIAACDTVSEDNEHAEVEGLVITQGNQEVVRVAEASVTGSLTIESGSTSALYSIVWMDHDGDVTTEPDTDAAFSLGTIVADESIVSVVHQGKFGFAISGTKAGNTSLRIQLKHNDHPDFTTPDIPLTVVSGSSSSEITQ